MNHFYSPSWHLNPKPLISLTSTHLPKILATRDHVKHQTDFGWWHSSSPNQWYAHGRHLLFMIPEGQIVPQRVLSCPFILLYYHLDWNLNLSPWSTNLSFASLFLPSFFSLNSPFSFCDLCAYHQTYFVFVNHPQCAVRLASISFCWTTACICRVLVQWEERVRLR